MHRWLVRLYKFFAVCSTLQSKVCTSSTTFTSSGDKVDWSSRLPAGDLPSFLYSIHCRRTCHRVTPISFATALLPIPFFNCQMTYRMDLSVVLVS